jgi:hypothetical protein
MCFGGEVDDELRLVDERPGHGGVGDVALDEAVSWAVDDVRQILHPSGVGQFVERGDLPVGMGAMRPSDEVRTNEAGSAGDEYLNHRWIPLFPKTPSGFVNDPMPARLREILKRLSLRRPRWLRLVTA